MSSCERVDEIPTENSTRKVQSNCSYMRSNQHPRHCHQKISIMESLAERPSTSNLALPSTPKNSLQQNASPHTCRSLDSYHAEQRSSSSFSDSEESVISYATQVIRKRKRDKSSPPGQNKTSRVDVFTKCHNPQNTMKYKILGKLVSCQTRQLSENYLNDPPLFDESAESLRYSSSSCHSQAAVPLKNDPNVEQIVKLLTNQVCHIPSPTSSCRRLSYETFFIQADDITEPVGPESFDKMSGAVIKGTRPKLYNEVTKSLCNVLTKNSSSEDEVTAGFSHTSIESDDEKTTLGKMSKVPIPRSERPYQKVGRFKNSNNTQRRVVRGNKHSEVLNSYKRVTNEENCLTQNYSDVRATGIDDYNGNMKPKKLHDHRFTRCQLNDGASSTTELEGSGTEETDNEHLAFNSSHSSCHALATELESLVAKSTAKHIKNTFKGRLKTMVLKESERLRPNMNRSTKFSQESRLPELRQRLSSNQTIDYPLNESKLCNACNTLRPHNPPWDFDVGHFYSGFNMDIPKNQPAIVYGKPVGKHEVSGLRNIGNEKSDCATQTEKGDHHSYRTSMNYGQVSEKSFMHSRPPVVTELSIKDSNSFFRRIYQSEVESKIQGITYNSTNIQQAHSLNKSDQDVCSYHETSQLNIGNANIKFEPQPDCDVTYLETPLNDTNEPKIKELEGCVSSEDEKVTNVLKADTSWMPPHLPIVGDSATSQDKSKIFTSDHIEKLADVAITASRKNLLCRISSSLEISLLSTEHRQSTTEESLETTDESRLAMAKRESIANSSLPNIDDSPANMTSRCKHLKVPLTASKNSRRLEKVSGMVSRIVSETDNTPQRELPRQIGASKKEIGSKSRFVSYKCHSTGKLQLDHTKAVQTDVTHVPRKISCNDVKPVSDQEGSGTCSDCTELSSYSCQKGQDGDGTNHDDSEVGYYDSTCDSASNSSDLENMNNEIPEEGHNGITRGSLPSEQFAFTSCENEKVNTSCNQLVERLSLNKDSIQGDCDYENKGGKYFLVCAKFLFGWLTRRGKNMESKSCSNTHLLTNDFADSM